MGGEWKPKFRWAPKGTPGTQNASQKSWGGAKIRKFGAKFKFGQFILGKIIKSVATRCHIKNKTRRYSLGYEPRKNVVMMNMMMMMTIVIANETELHITDSRGLSVTNGSTISFITFISRLICSTPYDHRYNFTYSWKNVYSSQVVAGNTLILRDAGSFEYRCTLEHVFHYLTLHFETPRTQRCSVSRTVHGNVSSPGTV